VGSSADSSSVTSTIGYDLRGEGIVNIVIVAMKFILIQDEMANAKHVVSTLDSGASIF